MKNGIPQRRQSTLFRCREEVDTETVDYCDKVESIGLEISMRFRYLRVLDVP